MQNSSCCWLTLGKKKVQMQAQQDCMRQVRCESMLCTAQTDSEACPVCFSCPCSQSAATDRAQAQPTWVGCSPEKRKLKDESPLQGSPWAAECNHEGAIMFLAFIAIAQQQAGAYTGLELAQGNRCQLLVDGSSFLHTLPAQLCFDVPTMLEADKTCK